MSQGVVKVTPRPNGSLKVTVADPNLFGVKAGDNLSFPDEGIAVEEEDTVDCTITGLSTCTVDAVR